MKASRLVVPFYWPRHTHRSWTQKSRKRSSDNTAEINHVSFAPLRLTQTHAPCPPAPPWRNDAGFAYLRRRRPRAHTEGRCHPCAAEGCEQRRHDPLRPQVAALGGGSPPVGCVPTAVSVGLHVLVGASRVLVEHPEGHDALELVLAVTLEEGAVYFTKRATSASPSGALPLRPHDARRGPPC